MSSTAPSPFRFAIPQSPSLHPSKRRKLHHDDTATELRHKDTLWTPWTNSRGPSHFKFPSTPASTRKFAKSREDATASGDQRTARDALQLTQSVGARQHESRRDMKPEDLGDAFTNSRRPAPAPKTLHPIRRPSKPGRSSDDDVAKTRTKPSCKAIPPTTLSSTATRQSNASHIPTPDPNEQEDTPPHRPSTPKPLPPPQPPRTPLDASTPPSAQPPPTPPTFLPRTPALKSWHIPSPNPLNNSQPLETPARATPPRPPSRYSNLQTKEWDRERRQFTPRPSFRRPTSSTSTTAHVRPRLPAHTTPETKPRPRFHLTGCSGNINDVQASASADSQDLAPGLLAEVFSPHKRKSQRFVPGGWAEEMRGLVFSVAVAGTGSSAASGSGLGSGPGTTKEGGLGDVRDLLKELM